MPESSQAKPPKKQLLVRNIGDSNYESLLLEESQGEKITGCSVGEALGSYIRVYGKKNLGIQVFTEDDHIGDNIEGLRRLLVKKVCEKNYNCQLVGAHAGDEISIGRTIDEAVGNYVLTYEDKFKLFDVVKK